MSASHPPQVEVIAPIPPPHHHSMKNKTNSLMEALEWVKDGLCIYSDNCIYSGGETRHSWNLDFQVKFDFEGQGQSPHIQEVLHLWSKFDDPSLNGWWVIAWSSLWMIHTQRRAMTIPEGKNWPRMSWGEMSLTTQQSRLPPLGEKHTVFFFLLFLASTWSFYLRFNFLIGTPIAFYMLPSLILLFIMFISAMVSNQLDMSILEIWEFILEIWEFKNLTLKFMVNIIGGVRDQNHSGSNTLFTCIPFVPCQSNHPFLRYDVQFQDVNLKIQGEVHSEVKGQSHTVDPTSYRFIRFSFHVNWSIHSRDMAASSILPWKS